jgi:hypothetical protein
MQVISGSTESGDTLTQEQFDEDLPILEKKFEKRACSDPIWGMFGGVITLSNGNKYQVCG